ncbi:Calbindin-32 [Blattella germanica]|nr:Calbindin-32 [Blattella germanica]
MMVRFLVFPLAVSDSMLVELKQCFMEAYDDNQDGKIDIRENFLRDLLKEAKKINDVSEDKLIEYTDTMIVTSEGKLSVPPSLQGRDRMTYAFMRSAKIEGATKLTKDDIERVFSLYDRDNNGTIENEELRGFLKDLLELVKKDYDAQDLHDFEETILQGVDYNQDGKINRKELTMILLALAKHNQEEEPSA